MHVFLRMCISFCAAFLKMLFFRYCWILYNWYDKMIHIDKIWTTREYYSGGKGYRWHIMEIVPDAGYTHERQMAAIVKSAYSVMNMVDLETGQCERVYLDEEKGTYGYGCYEFVCQDNGIGMSKEYLEQIFEPFSRAEDSRVSKIEGTGLGMTIARTIVQMMNGDISVESEKGKNAFAEDVLASKRAGMNEHVTKPLDVK